LVLSPKEPTLSRSTNELRSLASQTALYGLSTVVGRLLNYLLVPLHTRLFEPQEYGVITDFYAMAALLAVIYTYGMETAFFRFVNRKDQNVKAVYATSFYAVLATSLILSVLLWMNADSLAVALRHPDKAHFVRWFSLIFALDAVSALPFARLRQEGRSWSYVTLKFSNILILVGLQVYFLVIQPAQGNTSSFTSLDGVVLSNLVANGITLLFLLRGLPLLRDFDTRILRPMLAYAWPLLVAGLAGMFNETLDRVLLKYRLGGTLSSALWQVGVYGAVYKLAVLMSLYTQAFRMGAEPFFFRKNTVNPDNDPKDSLSYGKVFWYYSFIGWGLFLVVTLGMDAAKLLIGPAYHEGLPVVPILLLANLCLGWYYNHSIWFKTSDQTHWGLWIGLGAAVLTVVGNWFLIPLYGYTASAWVTLVCYASMFAASLLASRLYNPISYPWKGWLLLGAWALFLYGLDSWLPSGLGMFNLGLKFLLLIVYVLGVPLFRKFGLDR